MNILNPRDSNPRFLLIYFSGIKVNFTSPSLCCSSLKSRICQLFQLGKFLTILQNADRKIEAINVFSRLTPRFFLIFLSGIKVYTEVILTTFLFLIPIPITTKGVSHFYPTPRQSSVFVCHIPFVQDLKQGTTL